MLLGLLNILDVWLGSIHVLKSSFSIICVVHLARISTVVEKNVEEIVVLLRFFRNWPNKVSSTYQMWLVIKRHSRQLGLDFADE